MEPHRLTAQQARRIAVRAQWLDRPAPDDPRRKELLATVEQLTFLQLDPTAAIAPTADLVAYTRLGAGFRPAQLTEALEVDRSLYEHRAYVRPVADLGLHLAEMATWGGADSSFSHAGRWIEANAGFRRALLDQLRSDGPILSRDIADTAAVPWASTGWTGNRNVTQMLEFLSARGEVAIAGRRGRQRVWDVADRVYPADVEIVPAAEAKRRRDARWLRALGVARPNVVAEAGEPADVEGTTGVWRVDPVALQAEQNSPFRGRTAFLSPFDRLIHDRVRALDLFGFSYKLEMYVPKADRRWGYFALPILHHDQLIGKLDATADRKASLLRVDAIHRDRSFTKAMTRSVDAELGRLARWLGLHGVSLTDR